jgi:hypothetical protein
LGAAILALFFAGQSSAQENLDSGKTPAQLFASDCAICHKSPSGLSKPGNALGGLLGLQGFLRTHYTASREVAAAIAAYVQAADRGPAPADKRAKPKEKAKPGESQAAKPKNEPKNDTKPDASKGIEAKPAEGKPTEGAPTATKADADKPTAKPESKPDSKPDTAAKPESEKKPD